MNRSVTIAGVQSARITYKDRPVCTTQQLAQFYGCTEKNIGDNHANNRDRFEEGKHFIKLEGDALRAFRNLQSDEIGSQISPMVRSLILWTELGAARHAKMLTADKAWEVFEELESAYFRREVQPSIDSHEGALLMLQQLTTRQLALIQENKRTTEALALAAPKVDYVDRYVSTEGSKGFREVAKLLGAKESEFRAFLKAQHVMYQLNGTWTAYQMHFDAGRFVAKTGMNQANEHAYIQARFTSRGVQWIAGEWGKYKAQLAQEGMLEPELQPWERRRKAGRSG